MTSLRTSFRLKQTGEFLEKLKGTATAVTFVGDDEGTWREKMGAWLVERGWGHLCIAGSPPEMLGPALSIVSGKSPRGDWLHATVWCGRELLHDPHPSRAGLVGEPVDTIVLVPLA